MRVLMIAAAVVAAGGCNRSGGNNGATNATNNAATANAASANAAAPAANQAVANSAAPAAASANANFPPNFPGDDLQQQGGECIAYLSLAMQAGARPMGRDEPIMEQASGQWQSALMQSNVPENEWRQLVASSIAVLDDVPAAQRDAAANWCVENAPEVDPEG